MNNVLTQTRYKGLCKWTPRFINEALNSKLVTIRECIYFYDPPIIGKNIMPDMNVMWYYIERCHIVCHTWKIYDRLIKGTCVTPVNPNVTSEMCSNTFCTKKTDLVYVNYEHTIPEHAYADKPIVLCDICLESYMQEIQYINASAINIDYDQYNVYHRLDVQGEEFVVLSKNELYIFRSESITAKCTSVCQAKKLEMNIYYDRYDEHIKLMCRRCNVNETKIENHISIEEFVYNNILKPNWYKYLLIKYEIQRLMIPYDILIYIANIFVMAVNFLL